MDAERNFLFGLAAVKSGLIDARQLAEAGTAWMEIRDRPLAELLTERGWLSPAEKSALEDRVLHDLESPTVAASAEPDPAPLASTIEFSPREAKHGLARDASTRPIPQSNGNFSDFQEDEEDFGPRYEVITLHATGGIGRVWKVYDRVLKREIALKELRPDRPRHRSDERRFFEEARITAVLEHPSIVPAYDLYEDRARPFYTMMFVRGDRTLKDAAREYHHHQAKDDPRQGAPTFRLLLENFLRVCDAIGFAHSKGVIHRDLKGPNVVLGDFGQACVLDWGLARRLNSAEDLLARPTPGYSPSQDEQTIDGYPIGTPNYMPPEQAEGIRDKIGTHSDIFGLGAVLYQILTGRPPYEGRDANQIVALAVAAEFLIPSKIVPDTSPALEAICLKAMSKDPAGRYPSAEALGDEVRHWLADEPVEAYPDGSKAQIARWARKNQAKVAGAGAILITALATTAIWGWRLNQEIQRVHAANIVAFVAKEDELSDFTAALGVINAALATMQTDLPAVRDPAADQVRLKLAEAAVALVETLMVRHATDPKIGVALGDLLREAAKVHGLAYRFDTAETLTRRAIGVLAGLEAFRGLPPDAKDRLASYHLELGKLLLEQGRPAEAEPMVNEAIERTLSLRRQAGNQPPSIRTEARSLMVLGDVLRERGASEAAASYESAVLKFNEVSKSAGSGPLDRSLIVEAQIRWGACLRDSNQLDKSLEVLREARRLANLLHEENPGNNDRRDLLASSEMELALALAARPGEREEACLHLADAIKLFEELRSERPSIIGYDREAALAHMEHGGILAAMGKTDQADVEWEKSGKILLAITTAAPGLIEPKGCLSRVSTERAKLAIDRGQKAAAATLLSTAETCLVPVLKANPAHPRHLATQDTIRQLKKQLEPEPKL